MPSIGPGLSPACRSDFWIFRTVSRDMGAGVVVWVVAVVAGMLVPLIVPAVPLGGGGKFDLATDSCDIPSALLNAWLAPIGVAAPPTPPTAAPTAAPMGPPASAPMPAPVSAPLAERCSVLEPQPAVSRHSATRVMVVRISHPP